MNLRLIIKLQKLQLINRKRPTNLPTAQITQAEC